MDESKVLLWIKDDQNLSDDTDQQFDQRRWIQRRIDYSLPLLHQLQTPLLRSKSKHETSSRFRIAVYFCRHPLLLCFAGALCHPRCWSLLCKSDKCSPTTHLVWRKQDTCLYCWRYKSCLTPIIQRLASNASLVFLTLGLILPKLFPPPVVCDIDGNACVETKSWSQPSCMFRSFCMLLVDSLHILLPFYWCKSCLIPIILRKSLVSNVLSVSLRVSNA